MNDHLGTTTTSGDEAASSDAASSSSGGATTVIDVLGTDNGAGAYAAMAAAVAATAHHLPRRIDDRWIQPERYYALKFSMESLKADNDPIDFEYVAAKLGDLAGRGRFIKDKSFYTPTRCQEMMDDLIRTENLTYRGNRKLLLKVARDRFLRNAKNEINLFFGDQNNVQLLMDVINRKVKNSNERKYEWSAVLRVCALFSRTLYDLSTEQAEKFEYLLNSKTVQKASKNIRTPEELWSLFRRELSNFAIKKAAETPKKKPIHQIRAPPTEDSILDTWDQDEAFLETMLHNNFTTIYPPEYLKKDIIALTEFVNAEYERALGLSDDISPNWSKALAEALRRIEKHMSENTLSHFGNYISQDKKGSKDNGMKTLNVAYSPEISLQRPTCLTNWLIAMFIKYSSAVRQLISDHIVNLYGTLEFCRGIGFVGITFRELLKTVCEKIRVKHGGDVNAVLSRDEKPADKSIVRILPHDELYAWFENRVYGSARPSDPSKYDDYRRLICARMQGLLRPKPPVNGDGTLTIKYIPYDVILKRMHVDLDYNMIVSRVLNPGGYLQPPAPVPAQRA